MYPLLNECSVSVILLHDFSCSITSELFFCITCILLTKEEHETESFGAMVKNPEHALVLLCFIVQ